MNNHHLILGILFSVILSSGIQADDQIPQERPALSKNIEKIFHEVVTAAETSVKSDPKIDKNMLETEINRLKTVSNGSLYSYSYRLSIALGRTKGILSNYYDDILKNYNESFTQEFPDIAKKAKGVFYGKIVLPIVSAAAGAFMYKKYGKQRLEQFLIQKKWTVKNRQKAIIAGGIVSAIIGGTVSFLSVVITGNFIFNKGEKDRLNVKNVLLHQLKMEAKHKSFFEIVYPMEYN